MAQMHLAINQKISIAHDNVNGYRLFVGYKYSSLDTDAPDPAEYVAYLHKEDESVCYWFTTVGSVSGSKYHHRVEILDPKNNKSHMPCTKLCGKEFIGFIRPNDMNIFNAVFEATKARESQFTIFRFLWDLVDERLVLEEDVQRVMPGFRFRRESLGFIDHER